MESFGRFDSFQPSMGRNHMATRTADPLNVESVNVLDESRTSRLNVRVERVHVDRANTDVKENIPLEFVDSTHQKPLLTRTKDPNKTKRTNSLWFDRSFPVCLQMVTCLFIIFASSMAIAALIFALLNNRRLAASTSITTTTSTTATTTSTSSTTSTSTSSITTTSTSSTTSTTTTSTTTSTTSTSSTSMCSTTTMTTRVTATPLPSQCSSFTSINDGTRSSNYSSTTTLCDLTTFSTSTWVKFTGSSGVSLSNCPVATQHCGTDVTGWYSGVYPAIAGQSTNGSVCFNWLSNYCYWQTTISITNCNGFYVYYLGAPPVCNARYCTI